MANLCFLYQIIHPKNEGTYPFSNLNSVTLNTLSPTLQTHTNHVLTHIFFPRTNIVDKKYKDH